MLRNWWTICHDDATSRASASAGSPVVSVASRIASARSTVRTRTASTRSARVLKWPYRVIRPTPAAAAMPAMLVSGSRARQSVAASRIAATLRRASAVAVATITGAQAGTRLLARISARTVAVAGLALAAAGYALAARWPQPAVMVTGLSIAALGIGATFVTAFTASLTDAAAAEGGLRSALVNTFHELGGAVGVAVLSSAAGVGLVMAHLGSHDFARAFTAGAAGAAVCLAIAAVLVPAVPRKPAG
jgi:hypothetical protein